MKHKETADDRAIKDASAIQRAAEKEGFPEMEDPERYEKQKQSKKLFIESQKKRKKEAREDRERTSNIFKHFFGKWRNKGTSGDE
jgi:hypothetical protein